MKKKSSKSSFSNNFQNTIKKGYEFSGEAIHLGAAIDKKPITDLLLSVPLATMNRHGLVAGATGTGKTKTLQHLAEELSKKGVPVLLMDIKGDLSGLCQPGEKSEKILKRQKEIGLPWEPKSFPVEFLTISNEKGVRLRATVSEFGPLLFSRILDINETQSGVVAIIFKYCDDHKYPLLDLKDFKKVLQYLTNEGKAELKNDYGLISTTSASAILRKVLQLEEQGGDIFFGEKSFDVEDLLTKNNGQGKINILRLTDIQNRPKLFSTFMLCLMAEIFEKFPEVGDIDKPKLVMFIDEAHLIFDQAPKVLLQQINNVVKLIRSKGVGVYFSTQNPADISDEVLSQLGMKIQHSLRAFTAKDRKSIKLAAENYPDSKFYDIDELLTSLGTGEALVTVLNENGNPTPVAYTLMCAPESRMGTITESEIEKVVSKSELITKYNEDLNRDSAYEMLSKKIGSAAPPTEQPKKSTKKDKSVIDEIAKSPMAKQIGRTIAREITRGIFGVFKK